MPNISVTLSGNAGVCIELQNQRIWVDALYGAAQTGFSSMDANLAQRVLDSAAFASPNCICYTHCHSDHYSKELTQQAMRYWPKAKVLSAKQELEGQVFVQGEEFCFEKDGVKIRFIKLPHEGAQYQNVPHYGLFIQANGCNVLLPGDCALATPELVRAIAAEKIHLAILDFPWITLKRGQEFLQEVIQPEHILAYHLPFEDADINGYRIAAEKAQKALSSKVDVRLLYEPLQTETVII